MQSLLWVQTLLIMAGTSFSYYTMSSFDTMSAAYGGGVALFSSLFLMRRINRAIKSTESGVSQVMAQLYVGVVQRYIFVVLGLAVGLAYFKFNAKPLLIVFGIAQLAYFMPWQGNE